jgi:DNA-binding MarR family transcriptional regulator
MKRRRRMVLFYLAHILRHEHSGGTAPMPSVRHLSHTLGIPLSTMHSILKSLYALGYIEARFTMPLDLLDRLDVLADSSPDADW